MEKLPKYLTRSEAKRLRSAVRRGDNQRDIAIFELLLRYGPRASEVGMLKVSDIDLDADTITIPRLKNGKLNVWPLFKSVKGAIEEWMEKRDSPTDFLFPGRQFRGLSRKRIWELMQSYSEMAKIPAEKRHPHACRHYAAVNALEAGLEIHDVQDLLGHRAISSTMVYAQITSSRRNEAARRLESYDI